jgi:aminomethyltransferase
MRHTTVLNAVHREMGAKMVDFGGWDMPLHYGSQISEHHAVRRDAGMFDVSHMRVVDIGGTDARVWLRRLLANNVDKLTTPGRALYSCMLNEQGGVIDDLIVYLQPGDQFRMVVNAATTEKDLAWMRHTAEGLDVSIAPRADLAMIAVQGPNARAQVWAALPGAQAISESLKPFHAVEFQGIFIARTGYTGEDGFELMLPVTEAEAIWRKLHQQGVQPIGLGARDTLRLEAGMNLYGQDMDETTSPFETGLAWTVDFKSDRDFIGKSALVGQTFTQQQVGVLLQDKGVLRGHQKVETPLGQGEITSGSFSPTLQQSIALARVPMGIAPGDVLTVQVRDKPLQVKVVGYPFVRNGRSLVS